jgi:thiamine kinase-like enzyme
MHTPFMMTEYVEGAMPSSLGQIPAHSLEMLRHTLSLLSQLHPPGIPSYGRASDYLKHVAEVAVGITKGPTGLSPHLTASVNSFGQAVKELGRNIDASCVWSGKTMHGDLQESNLVLQKDGVLLLDVGSCCVGEPLFDLAYLISQSEGSRGHHASESVFDRLAEASKIESLIPLALSSAIGWSIGFLVNLERKMIEPGLVSPDVGPRVAAYISQKMDYLSSYLAA